MTNTTLYNAGDNSLQEGGTFAPRCLVHIIVLALCGTWDGTASNFATGKHRWHKDGCVHDLVLFFFFYFSFVSSQEVILFFAGDYNIELKSWSNRQRGKLRHRRTSRR
jgi:hypothetical protein